MEALIEFIHFMSGAVLSRISYLHSSPFTPPFPHSFPYFFPHYFPHSFPHSFPPVFSFPPSFPRSFPPLPLHTFLISFVVSSREQGENEKHYYSRFARRCLRVRERWNHFPPWIRWTRQVQAVSFFLIFILYTYHSLSFLIIFFPLLFISCVLFLILSVVARVVIIPAWIYDGHVKFRQFLSFLFVFFFFFFY